MGASTNRTGLAYVKEVAWGVNPATVQTDINFTGEGLAFNIDNITSNSIRSDRQVTDLIQTGAECTGNIDVEIQYGGYDELLLGALFASAWSGVSGGGSTTITSGTTVGNLDFTLVSAANTITFGSSVTHGLVEGQTFVLAGSASDDGTHVALDVTGQVITVTSITGDEVLDETDAATVVPNIEIINIGTTAATQDLTLASAGNTITLGASLTHNIVAGQWFKLTGSTGAADDGYHQATVVAGQVITVASITLDETIQAGTLKGSMARNGSTTNSFWIERTHDDVTQFFQFAGMVVNTFSIDFSANSVLTAAFNFMGKSATLTQVTSGTGSNTGSATTDYMNAVANVGNVRIDGVAVASCLLQQMTMEINNNVRGIASIGQLGFCDVVEGEVGVTGNMNMYFNDETYYDLYLAATAFSFDAIVTDGAGNSYIFTLPNCKFSADGINAGAKNGDVMENTSYQAIMDGTLLYTVQIDKIPA